MKKMNPPDLAYALKLLDWVPDRYGHLQKVVKGVKHRLVLGPLRVSLEVQTRVTPTATNPSRTQWRTLDEFSYNDISITQDSQIRMGSKLF